MTVKVFRKLIIILVLILSGCTFEKLYFSLDKGRIASPPASALTEGLTPVGPP
jgi:hypothetical protein